MPKTEWRIIPDTDGKERIRAEYELTKIGNQDPYFSLTADIERKEGTRWADAGGGCCHEQIVLAFPELKPLTFLHLATYPQGLPMHYLANSLFWRDEYVRMFFDTFDVEREVEKKYPDPDQKTIDRWVAKRTHFLGSRLSPVLQDKTLKTWTPKRSDDKREYQKDILDPLEAKRKMYRVELERKHKDFRSPMRHFASTVMLGIFEEDKDLYTEFDENTPDNLVPNNGHLHVLLTSGKPKVKQWLQDRAPRFPAMAKAMAEKFKLVVPSRDTNKRTMEEILAEFAETGLGELCKEHNITLSGGVPTDKNPFMDADGGMRHYKCTIDRDGLAELTITYSMGSGITAIRSIKSPGGAIERWEEYPRPPHIGDVMECLITDAQGLEGCQGFEDWASEYGYDSDSRKAKSIYDRCVEQNEEFKEVLGDLYKRFIGHEEEAAT